MPAETGFQPWAEPLHLLDPSVGSYFSASLVKFCRYMVRWSPAGRKQASVPHHQGRGSWWDSRSMCPCGVVPSAQGTHTCSPAGVCACNNSFAGRLVLETLMAG